MNNIFTLGMGTTAEAIAHYMHGAATVFFLVWTFRIFPSRKKNNMLMMLFFNLAFLALCNLRDMIFLFNGMWENPYVSGLTVTMDMIFIPLLCCYFFEVLSPGWSSVRRVFNCIAPQILFMILYAVFPSQDIINLSMAFTSVFMLISVGIIIRLFFKYRRYIVSNYSYTETISTGWVAVGAGVMMVGTAIYMAVFTNETWAGNAVYYGMSVLAWVFLHSLAAKHTVLPSPSFVVFPSPWDKKEVDTETVHEQESPLLYQQIQTSLEQSMTESKLYLNPKLTLQELAAEIGTNRTYLSEYLNNVLETTFYEYVNAFRIKEACKFINEFGQRKSMIEIAEMSGFNSISTFNRSFAKVMGMTPSQYQKRR